MQNLIRHYRKQRGLSLSALGAAIGLTAQSVSRIETGKMRLSTDWMEHIARALRVRPVDLLDTPSNSAELVGTVLASGRIERSAPAPFTLAMPASGAIVVQMSETCGPYGKAEYLVCEPVAASAYGKVRNCDCLAELSDLSLLLCRPVAFNRQAGVTTATLAPLISGGNIHENQSINRILRIRLSVRMVS